MKLRDDRKVFIINKNNTATVMSEKDIKTSIRLYFRPMYGVVHYGYPSWFIKSGSYHPNT